MPEVSDFKISEVKLILKRRGLNYKIQNRNNENIKDDCLIFTDVQNGTQVCGKIVRTFNEGEIYYWPTLDHANLAPLIETLYVQNDLSIFLTTNFQISLKQIIHEEDFLYDSRCFDRKRSYAKGIFSGLSYLHGKSLCLMNLSDDNIAICKSQDKAVIKDFSCVTCSKKTIKSKLKVSELYIAPEAAKGEFDAITAEIWASGTLMLDMFLAHMVPWAIIDYKPKKVVQIVNKVNLEFLQAANIGSVVTYVDLSKFKVFLKCFFRLNPVSRITAKLASIASFLLPTCKDAFQFDNKVFPDAKLSPQEDNREFLNKIDSRNTPKCTGETQFSYIDPCENCFSTNFSDSKESHNGLAWSPIQQESSEHTISDSARSMEKSPKGQSSPVKNLDSIVSRSGSIGSMKEETYDDLGWYSDNSPGITLDMRKDELESQSVECPGPFLYETSNSPEKCESTTFSKSCKTSCQLPNEMLPDQANTFNESNYNCCQTKSLLLRKSKSIADNTISFKFCSKRTVSYSTNKCSQINKSNSDTPGFQNSDPDSNNLLEENNVTENVGVMDKQAENNSNNYAAKRTRYVRKVTKYRKQQREHTPHKRVENEHFFKNSKIAPRARSSRLYSGTEKSQLLNRPDLQEIRNKIIFIRKCQFDLENHLRACISEEFDFKQRKLLEEYHLLLGEEYLRLCGKLKKKYELTLDELAKLDRSINSISNYFENQRQNVSAVQAKNISYNEPYQYVESQRQNVKAARAKDISYNEPHQYFESQRQNVPAAQAKDISYNERRHNRFPEKQKVTEDNKKRDGWNVQNYTEKFEGKKITPEFNRRYSYSRAVEASIFAEENKSKDKLIGAKSKFDETTTEQADEEDNFETVVIKPCKIIPDTKQESVLHKKEVSEKKEKKSKRKKCKTKGKNGKNVKSVKQKKNDTKGKNDGEVRNDKKEKNDEKSPNRKRGDETKSSFFSSMCPGGKVEEATPDLSNLCDACKLNYYGML